MVSPSYYPLLLSGRIGWEKLTQDVAGVYDKLPAQDRAVAGIYADFWMDAGAIDLLGPKYGLPHAVSGSLTYYLWGPGYSWDVMIIITTTTNPLAFFLTSVNFRQPFSEDLTRRLVPPIFVLQKTKSFCR